MGRFVSRTRNLVAGVVTGMLMVGCLLVGAQGAAVSAPEGAVVAAPDCDRGWSGKTGWARCYGAGNWYFQVVVKCKWDPWTRPPTYYFVYGPRKNSGEESRKACIKYGTTDKAVWSNAVVTHIN